MCSMSDEEELKQLEQPDVSEEESQLPTVVDDSNITKSFAEMKGFLTGLGSMSTEVDDSPTGMIERLKSVYLMSKYTSHSRTENLRLKILDRLVRAIDEDPDLTINQLTRLFEMISVADPEFVKLVFGGGQGNKAGVNLNILNAAQGGSSGFSEANLSAEEKSAQVSQTQTSRDFLKAIETFNKAMEDPELRGRFQTLKDKGSSEIVEANFTEVDPVEDDK